MGWIFRRLPAADLLRAVSVLGEGVAALHRGRFVEVNPALSAITAYSRGELLALPSLLVLAPPEEREALAARLARRDGAAAETERFETHLLTRDGRRLAVEMAIWSPSGDHRRQLVLVRDISARLRARTRAVIQSAVPRVLSDAASFDAAAARLLELIGRSLGMSGGEVWVLVGTNGQTMTRRATWWDPDFDAGEPGPARRELSHTGRGLPDRVWSAAAPVIVADLTRDPGVLDPGVARPAGLAGAIGFPIPSYDRVIGVIDFFSPGRLSIEPGMVEAMGDIGRQIGHFLERRHTELSLEETIVRLTEVAASDSLTGLRNRREFDRLLVTLPRQRFAVFAIDVDNLKHVNDHFGHEAGDTMLRGVGRALATCVRGWDVVARVGGDEFAALMVDVDPAQAAIAAERMRVTVGGMSLSCGTPRISVGWAVGRAGTDPREVARLADAHLYEAKRGGRDRVSGGAFVSRGGVATSPEWAVRSGWPPEPADPAAADGSGKLGEVPVRGRRHPAHPTRP
jgi:diguanylate cyclase (GGDEF)-like protein/PAS domain S-box-containing protein